MVGVLGFSFSGSGQNAASPSCRSRTGTSAGRRASRPRRSPAAPSARCRACATPSSSRSARRRSPNSATPPASPSACRTAAATATTRCSAARNQLLGMAAQEQGARRRAPRRPGRRAAAAARHRPRQGQRARRARSPTSTAALSTALGSAYVNDFPNAGRLQRVIVQADAPDAHAAGRPAAPERAQRPGQAGAAVVVRHDALDHRRRCRLIALQRLSGDAHLRRRRARATAPARRWTRWSGWPTKLPRRLRLRMDRPVARGKASPARRRRSCCSASRCWPCSCAWPRCTRAGRSRSRCCWWCRSACSARCSARPCAACRTTCTSRSA